MMTDVQSRRSDNEFKITRVGVKGLKKPIYVKRPDKRNLLNLMPVIDVSVDLPAHLKGSHMSRNVEVVSNIVDESVRKPVESIEKLCERIVRDLIKKHEYASYSSAKLRADYFREVTIWSGKKSIEPYVIFGEACMDRNTSKIKNTIGVEVTGMNACPCAMEGVRELMKEEYDIGEGDYPCITHNQRNITTLSIQTSSDVFIEAEKLIDIVEEAMSSPTFEYLKRKDEAILVLNAHKKPRFVEDIVRYVLQGVLENFPDIPDDSVVKVFSESEESIHKHNAFAERITTIKELKE